MEVIIILADEEGTGEDDTLSYALRAEPNHSIGRNASLRQSSEEKLLSSKHFNLKNLPLVRKYLERTQINGMK